MKLIGSVPKLALLSQKPSHVIYSRTLNVDKMIALTNHNSFSDLP